MNARAVMAILVSAVLVLSPVALAASKDHKDTKAQKSSKVKTDAKKAAGKDRGTAWHGKDWKGATGQSSVRTSASTIVRPTPYQPPPVTAATTRPAGETTFFTPANAKYDYFGDHYGYRSSISSSDDVLGYVAPQRAAGNPYIYRR